jgi:putative oxidoreductase
MKNTPKYFVQFCVFLLIVLWVYAAVGKLVDFPRFRREMHNQQLWPFIKEILIYLLPPIEIATAGMLAFSQTLLRGLYTSLTMLITFTAYIVLALLHFFKHVPCPCGGIMTNMTWANHLILNITFLFLNIIPIVTIKRKEPA